MLKSHVDPMSHRLVPLDRLEVEAKLFRGLGDPVRLSLLRALATGPRSAGELARALRISPSNASNHLRCLLECGLVTLGFDGRFRVYSLAMPAIPRLLDAAGEVLAVAAPAIEACLNYGPPSRRALRAEAERDAVAALTDP